MAKEKQRIAATTELDEIDAIVSQKKREMQVKQLKKELDGQVKNLAVRAAEYTEKFGAEDYRTEIMVEFLDVALHLQEANELITGLTEVFTFLDTSVKFMDTSMNMFQTIIADSFKTSYGPFARWKQKRAMNKAVRNFKGRFTALTNTISGVVGMSHAIVGSLQGVSAKLKDTKIKRNKKYAKKGQEDLINLGGQNSRAASMVADILNQKGVATPASSSAPSASNSAPAPSTGADTGIEGL